MHPFHAHRIFFETHRSTIHARQNFQFKAFYSDGTSEVLDIMRDGGAYESLFIAVPNTTVNKGLTALEVRWKSQPSGVTDGTNHASPIPAEQNISRAYAYGLALDEANSGGLYPSADYSAAQVLPASEFALTSSVAPSATTSLANLTDGNAATYYEASTNANVAFSVALNSRKRITGIKVLVDGAYNNNLSSVNASAASVHVSAPATNEFSSTANLNYTNASSTAIEPIDDLRWIYVPFRLYRQAIEVDTASIAINKNAGGNNLRIHAIELYYVSI